MKEYVWQLWRREGLPFGWTLIGLILLGLPAPAWPHGSPINLRVDPATNRLGVLGTFDPALMFQDPGVTIFSDSPGLAVSFPANGLAPDTTLSLDIVEGLRFWDGTDVVATPATVKISHPIFDSLGNLVLSDVPYYLVDAGGGMQHGMTWATYDGSWFWEADGLLELLPVDAEPGIYGITYRIGGGDYLPTLPFLVPLVYDPNASWSIAERDEGVERLQAQIRDLGPADFDGNRLYDCSDIDELAAKIAVGNNDAQYDLTGDGTVDSADLEQWLADAGLANLTGGGSYRRGDANLDGFVDISDFNAWNERKFSARAGWCGGDFNADGNSDISDFNAWNANKFTVSGDAPRPVPEPGNLALLAFGVISLYMGSLTRLTRSGGGCGKKGSVALPVVAPNV